MNEITKEILALAANGNQYAIEELYKLTYNSVYKSAKVLIQDEDTVLDIVQDSYVKAFRSLEQLDRPENFRPWIRRIAANKAKDYLKKKKPILFSEMAGEDGEEVDFLDDRMEHYPEIVMDRKETTRLIREILDTLSEDQRLVIGMFYYEQMSVREIADTLGCSENTVKSRLNYGRKKVEVKVRDLEKRGCRLYSLAPLPFLLSLFAMEASAAEIPSATVLQAVTAECAGAGTAAGTAAAGAGAKAAAGAGMKALTAKIIAGVLAVTVAGGGTVLALSANDRRYTELPRETAVQETVDVAETALPAETVLDSEEAPAVPETAAETDPAVAAEEAYQGITAEYQSVMAVDSSVFLDAPYNYFNGDHAAVCYYHMYHGDRFYYAFYDIDGNGTEELLIGFGQEDYIRIVDLYGFDGEKAVQLIDEPTLGDRSQLSVMDDGSIYVFGSGGAAVGSHSLWRIGDSGYSLETVFEYSYDFNEGYDGVYHGADGSTVTDAQFNEMFNGYNPLTDFLWMPLEMPETDTDASFDSVLEDIRVALTVPVEDYDSNMAYYDSLYSHLGDGAMWELLHRQTGDYTMSIWSAYMDMDGDGRADLVIGRGISPDKAYPIRIFTGKGEVIFGDAIYTCTESLYGGSVPSEWDYLGG